MSYSYELLQAHNARGPRDIKHGHNLTAKWWSSPLPIVDSHSMIHHISYHQRASPRWLNHHQLTLVKMAESWSFTMFQCFNKNSSSCPHFLLVQNPHVRLPRVIQAAGNVADSLPIPASARWTPRRSSLEPRQQTGQCVIDPSSINYDRVTIPTSIGVLF